MGISQITDMVESCDCNLVEVTGGEPLLQDETPQLINELLDLGYTVLLETNGSQDISRVDERCIQIVDMKCPSSGMSQNNDYQNLKRLRPRDELKFVLGDREDYLWAKAILDQVPGYPDATRNIFFSTVFDKLAPATVVKWILEDKLNVRLQLQMHKYIWDPDMKGV